MRMTEDEIPRNVLTIQLDERSKRGWLKLQWIDDASNYVKLFGLRDWRAIESDCDRCRKLLQEVKTKQ